MTAEPLILAIETSGRTGSAALAAGAKLLAEIPFQSPLKHSAEVFPAIKTLLDKFDKKPKQIEQIYISVGPGSFTGLRITVTIAKTICLANPTTKIVAVDTLDIIAANAIDFAEKSSQQVKKIAAVLDAKRGRFFTAVYEIEGNHPKKISSDSLMTAEQFLETCADPAQLLWLLGEGLVYYKEKFTADGISFLPEEFWYPTAAKLFTLGRNLAEANSFTDPLTLAPNYLQKPDAIPKKI